MLRRRLSPLSRSSSASSRRSIGTPRSVLWMTPMMSPTCWEVSLSNVSLCFNSSICFCRSSMSRLSRRDAFAGVGGQLHARMLDLHDDRVRLRARQRAGVILKPRQRLDRTMGAGGETVQEPVRCGVMRVGEPCVIVIALTGQVGEDAPGGVRDGLILLSWYSPESTSRDRLCEKLSSRVSRGSSPVNGSKAARSSATYIIEF